MIPDTEPDHESSPTAYLLDEIALYGYRPFSDEADPRPLPEERIASGAVADMFDALIATMLDTRIEPDLEDLCWSLANLFHRAEFRIQRELDDNEDAQKRSQREQDGSEVKSVELERLIREGIGLIERRNAMEFMRDAAGDQFELHFRKAWTPRTGSLVYHRNLTAAMIDSRDFLAAKRRSETEPMLPPRHPHRVHIRPCLSGSQPHLGRARQGACQISRHGPVSRRQSYWRRAYRIALGTGTQDHPHSVPA